MKEASAMERRRVCGAILLMLIDIHAPLEQQLREFEASSEVFAVSRCGEEPQPSPYVVWSSVTSWGCARVCVEPIAHAVNALPFFASL